VQSALKYLQAVKGGKVSVLQTQATLFIVSLVVGFALWLGGRSERLGAIAATSNGLSGYLYLRAFSDFGPWAFIVVDGLCLVIFFRLCWKCWHPWPLLATAAQTFKLICQLISLPGAPNPALTTALLLSVYGIILALSIGIFAAVRHRRSIGAKK
jgi:hypothetical protein